MDWISTVEQAFDESIQDLGVDMDEACDNGTYPKARDNVIDAVAAIFSNDYDPRLDEVKNLPFFRVYDAYVNLQFIANYMHTRMVERGDKLDKAEAENAKLRELVQDMYAAFVHGNCYRWCEFKEPCNYISDGKCQWYDRMAELGVEVNK